MKRTVRLDYTIGEGWLRPWVEGLRTGHAVASTCSLCESAQFPPLRICPACGVSSDGWTTLSGCATILHRTNGMDGEFALAHFDGAASAAVVRTDPLPAGATQGQLVPAPDGPPTMSLGPEHQE